MRMSCFQLGNGLAYKKSKKSGEFTRIYPQKFIGLCPLSKAANLWQYSSQFLVHKNCDMYCHLWPKTGCDFTLLGEEFPHFIMTKEFSVKKRGF